MMQNRTLADAILDISEELGIKPTRAASVVSLFLSKIALGVQKDGLEAVMLRNLSNQIKHDLF